VLVEQIRTGGDRNLAYLAADSTTGAAVIIDPSYTPEALVAHARGQGLTIALAFDTHGHGDHSNGDDRFESLTGLRPLHFGNVDPGTGKRVDDGAEFALGQLTVTVIHTPGHSPDSICLLIGNALFNGDTLFVGKVGGTDLAAGARGEYESLHQKLLALADDTRVYPGHDVGIAPASTIGHERATNPFLLQPDFAAFVDLKEHWAEYKREHGIA
jgi:hydroxyacylglutathione hydrolase